MSVEKIVTISGPALPLRGDNIDTDRIIPARFLRSISFEGLEQHLFADDRAQADAIAPNSHPISDPRYSAASILLVNANFGCGSSREHAPQAIRRRGFRAIIGVSYSEIFFGNSVALGMPCVTVPPEDAVRLQAMAEDQPATAFTLDLGKMSLGGGGVNVPEMLTPAAREGFLDGSWDATGLLLDRYNEVRAVTERLPYISGWR